MIFEIKMNEKIDNIIIIMVKFFLVVYCFDDGNLFWFVFKILIIIVISVFIFFIIKLSENRKLLCILMERNKFILKEFVVYL